MVSLFPLSLLFFFLFISTDICNSLNTTKEYLKLRLLYKNPFPSPTQALSSDTHRLSLLHNHQTIKSPVVSGAPSGSGQYFVSLSLGTPPQNLLLVADTGSDLIWVKCSACRNCSTHIPGSNFLARHSSTFSPHHCYDSPCRLVPNPPRSPCKRTHLHSPCRYLYSYADTSFTTGFFSKETTAFNTTSGREARHKNLAFGCGFRFSGPSLNGVHGVMGLGRGPISFSSQLGRRFGNKFSYCLMDYTLSPPPTSYLMIGGAQHDVVTNTSKMSFTPLQVNPLSPTFYYIGIKSVSVNGVKLPIDPSAWSIDELGNGGTVVDSGTTLTFVPEPAYRHILAAFRRRVRLPSPAEPTLGFDLCVNVSGVSRRSLSLPKLSLKLVGNSVLSPPSRNYFIETEDRVMCLAIQPVITESGISVIGNLMQQGFLFEFDRDGSRLGFSRHGCSLP